MNATLQKITDEQDARLFRLIQDRRLMVNVNLLGTAYVTDGEIHGLGQNLRDAIQHFESVRKEQTQEQPN